MTVPETETQSFIGSAENEKSHLTVVVTRINHFRYCVRCFPVYFWHSRLISIFPRKTLTELIQNFMLPLGWLSFRIMARTFVFIAGLQASWSNFLTFPQDDWFVFCFSFIQLKCSLSWWDVLPLALSKLTGFSKCHILSNWVVFAARQLRNVRFHLPELLKVKNVTVMIDTICQLLMICNASAQQAKPENYICLRP